jgi:hypothetical protein
MLVTYAYAAEEAAETAKGTSTAETIKSFSYWTAVNLGTVVPQRTRTPASATMTPASSATST